MERRYTAIVLGKIETGETDRIYTLYTKEQGKVRAVAKGVRKPEARLASQLETPVLSQVTVVGVRGLPKIAGAVLEEGFLSLRSDFDGLRRALEALAFLERLVDLDEPDEETFFLTVEYLQLADMLSALKNEHSVRLVTQAFLLKLFESLGYGLESAKDAASGARLKSGERYLFCPGAGGILPFGSPHATGEALPVSENTIKLLRLIKANRLKACLKIKAENVTLRELEQVTRRFYRWIAR